MKYFNHPGYWSVLGEKAERNDIIFDDIVYVVVSLEQDFGYKVLNDSNFWFQEGCPKRKISLLHGVDDNNFKATVRLMFLRSMDLSEL